MCNKTFVLLESNRTILTNFVPLNRIYNILLTKWLEDYGVNLNSESLKNLIYYEHKIVLIEPGMGVNMTNMIWFIREHCMVRQQNMLLWV